MRLALHPYDFKQIASGSLELREALEKLHNGLLTRGTIIVLDSADFADRQFGLSRVVGY